MSTPSTLSPAPVPNTIQIQGLREQIFASAAVLMPQVIATSTPYKTTGFALPSQVFEVIVAGSEHKQAILVYGDILERKPGAQGAAATTVAEALDNLLSTITGALGWYTKTLLGELEHSEECGGGVVDLLMVEEGFHFAAEQRWAQQVSVS